MFKYETSSRGLVVLLQQVVGSPYSAQVDNAWRLVARFSDLMLAAAVIRGKRTTVDMLV
jgi:hypothetical protein